MKYKDIVIPSWCTYPDPTMGEMGCWSLISGNVTSKEYCKNCECCSGEPTNEKEVADNQAMLKAYLLLQEQNG